MKFMRRFFFFMFALFQFQVFAQQPRVVIVNGGDKELKRSAHRLRIPVDQLKNAREALEEATDLVSRIEPYPAGHINTLVNSWQNLHRSKAKGIVHSFIQDLRSLASQPSDPASYQRATSAAMSLAQMTSEGNYEEMVEMIDGWPDPPESFGESAAAYVKNLRDQTRMGSLMQLSNSEPEKAYELFSQSRGAGSHNYSFPGQIAQRLMGMGKKTEALKIIDETMDDFRRNAKNPQALQQFESFVIMTAQLHPVRAADAFSQWATQLANQPQQKDCAAKLELGDAAVDLTCTESRILNVLRGLPSKTFDSVKAAESISGLQSKLNRIGGVDALNDSGMYGSPSMIIRNYNPRYESAPNSSTVKNRATINNPWNLIQELRGKMETNPTLVKQKLRAVVENPEDIDVLINMAMSASYQDPDMASVALEIAEPLLPQIEPIQRRSSSLQNLIRAFRQVDGEVDAELLKSGFIIADQLREEQLKANPNPPPGNLSPADQLEAFLIAETARDSYDLAINFVRSMENGLPKLMAMIQIVQALSQSNL